MSFACLFPKLVVYILLFLIQPGGASQHCGSLVTYRQYSALLAGAPKCFRNGCGNSTSESISSPCAPQSPCYPLWSVLKSQFEPDWCSSCRGDIACRIRGWPILNATALCETRPHSWLWSTTGACCVADSEPFEIAGWIEKLCNRSEWRKPFGYFGGMAREDWEEWIIPWNWTVRPERPTGNSSIATEDIQCQRTSLYLGLFALDNFAVVLFAILEGLVRYKLIKWDEEDERRNVRHGLISLLVKKIVLPSGVVWTLFVGALWVCLDIGINFANAYYIHRRPGFGHVPLVSLALLFCSRPSISWIPCFLGFVPDRKLKTSAGRAVWADIAYTSAFRESVMQVMGGIYLGRTGNVGRQRGFYLIHHLHPFIHGKDAFRMYIGALFWLIGCAVIISLWIVVTVIMIYDLQLREAIRKVVHPGGPPSDEPKEGYGKIRTWLNRYLIPHRVGGWIDNAEDRAKAMWTKLGDWFSRNVTQARATRWLKSYIVHGKYTPWGQYSRWRGQERVEQQQYEEERRQERKRKLDEIKEPVMGFMVLVGLAAYIAQWLFWDGFVKAMGPRYCPPNVGVLAVVWVIASVTGISLPFFMN